MELYPICDETLNLNANIWYSMSGTGESPFMRVGHTCVHVKDDTQHGKLYLIGGANPSECFNDVYILDLNTLSWDKLSDIDSSELSQGRYEHACFAASSKYVYVFGGADQEKNYNDLVGLNLEKQQMEKIELAGVVQPEARTYHCGVSFRDQLVVFGGGSSGKTPVNDSNVYIWNPTQKKWISLSLKCEQPSVRHGHVMLNYNDELIYMFGGMNNDTLFDDLWVLDLKKMTWNRQTSSDEVKPSARAAHGGVCINNNLYIFGGMDAHGNVLDDLWKYDILTNKWTQLDVFGYKPPARLDFAYCKVSLNESDAFFLVHGGMDNQGNIFDDCFLIKLD